MGVWWSQLPAAERRLRPPALSASRLLVLSFLGLVALGTAGFAFVPGLAREGTLSFVDALFMATSAVCVTGLTVVDVSSELTRAGQAWLLLLIQAGALGILTFAGAVAGIAGGRSRLNVEEAVAGPASMIPSADPRRLVRLTVTGTLATEAVGAAALWPFFRAEHGAGEAAWIAVFHAVSAFCNAGFSLFPDSLVDLRGQLGLLAVMGALIVVGGLGFPVLEDLRLRLSGRRRRLCLHSRLVLVASAALLVGGAVLYLVFESGGTLAPLSLPGKAANAMFMSVTARTAGFHTVDYDMLSNASLLLTLGLMWIGGAPASVAGGVKVTTVALVVLLLASRLRGDDAVSAGGRSVPRETLQRAAGLAVGAVLLLAISLLGLIVLGGGGAPPGTGDRTHLARLVFEVQSAFATVGLSMGATSALTPAARVLMVAVMLLGRLGPLVVLAAMALRRSRRAPIRYSHEDVLVG